MIKHRLETDLLGEVAVLIPEEWPPDAGFIMVREPIRKVPLLRIQSRCAYGEVFGSHHCDCGAQLKQAADEIRRTGGLVMYLEQEGRGAGVTAKAAAYRAAERDLIDTFTHYESAGIPPDLRSYSDAADALLVMGIRHVVLLTNNPSKLQSLRDKGIEVERRPLIVEGAAAAEGYLAAKRERGHLL